MSLGLSCRYLIQLAIFMVLFVLVISVKEFFGVNSSWQVIAWKWNRKALAFLVHFHDGKVKVCNQFKYLEGKITHWVSPWTLATLIAERPHLPQHSSQSLEMTRLGLMELLVVSAARGE